MITPPASLSNIPTILVALSSMVHLQGTKDVCLWAAIHLPCASEGPCRSSCGAYGSSSRCHMRARMTPGHLTCFLVVPSGDVGQMEIYHTPARRHTGTLGAPSYLLVTLRAPCGHSRGTRPSVLCELHAMRALSAPVFMYGAA